MRLPGGGHLSYCTNIHPGETWAEVLGALAASLPRVAQGVAAGAPFGVGLRLSAQAARELEESPRAFADLTSLLAEVGGYVPTLNGFPYGEFHRGSVKQGVYLPDWQDRRRVDYTLCLARLAARLAATLPGGPKDPTISTVPGCFRPGGTPAALAVIGSHLREVAVALSRLESESGIRVTVGLEPEPACLLETTTEGVEFLLEHVEGGQELRRQAVLLGLTEEALRVIAHRHIGLCLDTCHAAVGFESATETVALLRQEEILLTKIQVTSALALPLATPEGLRELAAFADDVYLHQVSVDTPTGLRRLLDLPEALADPSLLGLPWRVHFHVPVSESAVGGLATTRPFLEEILEAQRARPLTRQLEVETYTYDVMPAGLRGRSVEDVICRELEWTRKQLLA
jgi:sugar phosphate isomerase/epimerase